VAFVAEAELARLRARDPEALREIAEAYGRRLYRAALGMGHAASAAEDLVQEVFVTFLESLDRFEGRAQVGTWLYGILHHKSLERRRATRREEMDDTIDDLFESQFDGRGHWLRKSPAPDAPIDAAQTGVAIGECLEGLTDQQRAVFHLRQVEELSAAEVSKITGHSITHIGVLLHRARLRLRTCLEAKGWAHPR